MWNAHAKWSRLKNALRLRDLDPDEFSLDKLADVLERRGITDSQLNSVVWALIGVLEPPGCYMTHCKSHGGQSSPMNCAAGKTPGRCKIFKDYKKRIDARIAKDWRNVLNDTAKSIKYDELSPSEALKKAALAAETLKARAYSAAAGKRFDIALEGARAELEPAE